MEVEKRVVGGCWQLRFDLFLKWDKLLCLYFPWQVEREKNFWAAEHAVFSTNFLTQKLFHEKWLFYWKFHLHFSKSSVHFKDDCAEFSNSCNKHLTWLLNSLLLFTLEWVKVLLWDHIKHVQKYKRLIMLLLLQCHLKQNSSGYNTQRETLCSEGR